MFEGRIMNDNRTCRGMVLQCFEWIAHLVGFSPFFAETYVVKEFPDDVIVDILSRLPAECVINCRRVCKRWRLLTSSQYFIDLHLSKATTPTIFVHNHGYCEKREKDFGFYVYDPTTKKKTKMNKLRIRPGLAVSKSLTRLFDSCCGLMLITHWLDLSACYVFNPVTQESVAIECPLGGYVCGFFYHPRAKEFCILFLCFRGWPRNYYLYTFRSQVWRVIESATPAVNYMPTRLSQAVYNGSLYWISAWNFRNARDIPPCTGGVLVFDIIEEKFQVRHHPGYRCLERSEHKYMSLIAAAEHLYFSYVWYATNSINIWILDDCSTWAWVKKWKFHLNMTYQIFCEPLHKPRGYLLYDVKLVHIQDGCVWLDCAREGLYMYLLDKNTLVKHRGPPPTSYGSTKHSCKVFTTSLVSICQTLQG